MRWTMLLVASSVAAGLLVGGCGGGGEQVASAGSTLAGTVYSSSVSPAAAGNDKAAQDAPAPDCEVTVERVRDRQELASGRTDGQGRYRFEGLPTGDDVLVRAQLRSGEVLQTRTRLRNRACQADVTEDTTLVATAWGTVDQVGEPATANEREVGEAVAEACMSYQEQHRYEYGGMNGRGPDFTNQQQVGDTSMELLKAAEGDAVDQARQTAGEANCQRAADLVAAQLRAQGDTDFTWSAELRRRVAWSLMQRHNWTPDEVANVLDRVNSAGVSVEDVERLRTRVRQMIRERLDPDLDAVEAVAGVCIGDGLAERTRLRTQTQVEQFVQELIGDPTAE